MSHLLDVSMLVACAWHSHAQHTAANRWLDRVPRFATSPAIQMGFLRVSMSAAFGSSYADARTSLEGILGLRKHLFLPDDIAAGQLPPELRSRHEVTDAHYVTLARAHRLKFATLDDALCTRPWAAGVAINPLAAVNQ